MAACTRLRVSPVTTDGAFNTRDTVATETNSVLFVAFDSKGNDALVALGLTADTPLDVAKADCACLLGWTAAHEGNISAQIIAARGTAQAYNVEQGEFVQIIVVEGQQCSDFMALRSDGLGDRHEWLIDSTATRSMLRRSYLGPGLLDKFFEREIRHLLASRYLWSGLHSTWL